MIDGKQEVGLSRWAGQAFEEADGLILLKNLLGKD